MSLPVAILAGGLATRLRPIAERIPKVLVEVAGEPFAVHQIELLRDQGFDYIVFCIGHLGEMVQETLGDGSRWGVQLRYVFDGATPLGTGGALVKALPELGEAFLVLYGDVYLECDYAAVERAFLDSGRPALMTVFHNGNQWDRSNVYYADGRILRYDKHRPTPEMQHIDNGLGAFGASVLQDRPAGRPLDLSVLQTELADAGQLAAYEMAERFHEIGSLSGLEETRRFLAEKKGLVPR